MSHSKIEELLIQETLRDFYKSFVAHHGEGSIINYIGGAKLYDMICRLNPIEIDVEEKKRIWSNTKKDFRIKAYKVAEEHKKKQLEDIYKCNIAEWHLNKMGNEGKVYEI